MPSISKECSKDLTSNQMLLLIDGFKEFCFMTLNLCMFQLQNSKVQMHYPEEKLPQRKLKMQEKMTIGWMILHYTSHHLCSPFIQDTITIMLYAHHSLLMILRVIKTLEIYWHSMKIVYCHSSLVIQPRNDSSRNPSNSLHKMATCTKSEVNMYHSELFLQYQKDSRF